MHTMFVLSRVYARYYRKLIDSSLNTPHREHSGSPAILTVRTVKQCRPQNKKETAEKNSTSQKLLKIKKKQQNICFPTSLFISLDTSSDRRIFM